MKHALVVGLGLDTVAMLESILERFALQGVTDAVSCLWLRPYAVDRVIPQGQCRVYDLELDNERLSKLYFETEMRKWCGSNWMEWRHEIGSNRLLGKLSVYEHLEALYRCLVEAANALGNTSIHFYLIAPLHDPFASGAVFDVAYLLHRLALERAGSAYGVMLLPGINHDPVVKEDIEDDAVIRRAICYAALRELHFYSSRQSIFDHHRFVEAYIDESPFQSGDCYLIGGDQIALDYEEVRQNCAWWIYLQTNTPMIDALPRSDCNRGVFSAFGVASNDINDVTMVERIRRITFQATHALLADDDASAPVPQLAQPYLFTHFMDDARRAETSTVEVADQVQGHTIQAIDDRHRAVLKQLMQYEEELTNRAQKLHVNFLDEIKEDVYQLVTQPGMNLPTLQRIFDVNVRQFRDIYSESEAQRTLIEKEANTFANHLRQTRADYHFVQTFGNTVTVLFGIVFLLMVPTFAMLLVVGQIELVMGAIALLLAPILVWVYQHRTQVLARANFMVDQRQFLNLLNRLVTQRAISAYFYNIGSELTKFRTDTAISKVKYLHGELRNSGASLPSPPYNVEAIQAYLLEQAWNANGTLSHDTLQTEIEKRQILFQQTSEAKLLAETVHSLKAQSIPMLNFKLGAIPQSDRDTVLHITGLQNRDQSMVTQMTAYEFEAPMKWIDLEKTSGTRVPVVITLRNNIPLSTLTGILDWKAAYRQCCKYTVLGEAYTSRAFLHPTRLGIAIPDLYIKQEGQLPPIAMMMIVLLRLSEYELYLEHLCEQVRVAYNGFDGTNFDELCGALHDHPAVIRHILSVAQKKISIQQPIKGLRTLLQKRRAEPRLSEMYAEWEIWAESCLRQALDEGRSLETLTRLAQYGLYLEVLKRHDSV
jgi:predicted DNA-binding protein YlxM (UPF0122 family)